jgi:hypothetical protein
MDESDLDAHYLNSRTHPACEKCNVGFPSELEYTEVRRAPAQMGDPLSLRRSFHPSKYSTTRNYTRNYSARFARSSSRRPRHWELTRATRRTTAAASSVAHNSRTHPRWSRYIVSSLSSDQRATPHHIQQHFTETHLQIQDSKDSTTVRLHFSFMSYDTENTVHRKQP